MHSVIVQLGDERVDVRLRLVAVADDVHRVRGSRKRGRHRCGGGNEKQAREHLRTAGRAAALPPAPG